MAAAQVSGNAATLVNGIRVQCLDPTIFLEQTHMFSQFNLWLGDVRHLGGVVAVMRWWIFIILLISCRATKVRCLEEIFSELCCGKPGKEPIQVKKGNTKPGCPTYLSSVKSKEFWLLTSILLQLFNSHFFGQFVNRNLGEDEAQKVEGMFGRSRKEIMHHQIVPWQRLLWFHQIGKTTSPH